MGPKPLIVERHGWRVEIYPREPERRPQWEIRCEIVRRSDRGRERRGHRFFVAPDIADATRLDELSPQRRMELMSLAAKRIVMRELEEIFSEPEGGLDSVRPIRAEDLRS
jgi:hypothetical protein